MIDLFFELIAECLICLIIDDAADIMNGSGRTSHLSKGMKIFIVAAALLIFVAVSFFLLFAGIGGLLDGEYSMGVPFTILGIGFAGGCVVSFVSAYKRKRKGQ